MNSAGHRALLGAWRLRQQSCRPVSRVVSTPCGLFDSLRRQRTYARWGGLADDSTGAERSGGQRERRPRPAERSDGPREYASKGGGRGGGFAREDRGSSRGGYDAPRESYGGGASRGGYGESRGGGGYGKSRGDGGFQSDAPRRATRNPAADRWPAEGESRGGGGGWEEPTESRYGSGSDSESSPRRGGGGSRWRDDDRGASDRGASARGGGGGYGAARGGYGGDRDRRGAGGGYGRSEGRGPARYGSGSGGGGGYGREAGGYGREGGGGRYRDEYDDDEGGIKAPSPQSLLIGDAVFGVSPVYAAVFAGRRKLNALYVQESADMAKRKDDRMFKAIVEAAAREGATVQEVEKHTLNMMTDNRNHQGLVLDADPLDFVEVKVLPVADVGPGLPPPVWVALDEVSDPQNFGAILRSALYLGAAGVVTCQRNSAPLSPVVSKASSGAMEVLPVHSAKNLPQFLAACSVNGWAVVGADADGEPERPSVACSAFKVTRPTIVVFGSEGKGLRTNVRKVCSDGFVSVAAGGAAPAPAPSAGAPAEESARQMLERVKLDSLNVSVAAGIIIHSLLGAAADASPSPSAASHA